MKKIYTDVYKKVYDIENLKKAYNQTQKGQRKYKTDAINLSMVKERELTKLWRNLKNETYEVGEYIRFYVYEPKERLISAPRIRDKIVQYSCHLVLKEIYDNVFINESYACRDGKGAHKAVEKLQHNMRYVKYRNNKKGLDDGYILKMDIRKYFYSIDRKILKKLLRKKNRR